MTPKTEKEAQDHISEILANSPNSSKRTKEIIALTVMCKLWLYKEDIPIGDMNRNLSKLLYILDGKGVLVK